MHSAKILLLLSTLITPLLAAPKPATLKPLTRRAQHLVCPEDRPELLPEPKICEKSYSPFSQDFADCIARNVDREKLCKMEEDYMSTEDLVANWMNNFP
jgi:hypothetical protein